MNLEQIFTNEEINNYNLFIEKLKNCGYATREILSCISQYYQKYVTYNYDQLQLVKLTNGTQNLPSYDCYRAISKIFERINEINQISRKGEVTLNEIVREFNTPDKKLYSKKEATEMIDKVMLKDEGRPLTERNKEHIFKNYGNIKHVSSKKPDKFRHKTGGIRILSEIKEHDEIIGPNMEKYPPVYKNQMLKEGVCADYVDFETKLFKDLGIRQLKVEGIGTTSHVWSAIYLEEEQKWVHFDMTMAKFYQDNWIKEHEPYTEQHWVAASNKEIFEMQPTRKITAINNVRCDFSKENYERLDINEYEKEREY